MTNNIKIYLIIALAVITILLPMAGIAIIIGSAIAYYKRDTLSGSQKYVICAIPLIGGLVVAWLASTTIIEVKQAFGGDTAPLVWYSWLRLNTLHNPANMAGRIGFVVGAILFACGAVFITNKRNRDSGVGLVRGKKVLAGGFATPEDIADKCDFGFLKAGQVGVPLGLMLDKVVSVNPTKGKIKMAGHTLVIGATGTGKSYSYIRPQIIAAAVAGDSIVVTDPKGELFFDTANWLKSNGYDILVFNLASPEQSYRWNMITECKDMDEIIDLAEWMIMSAGDDEAFWAGGEVNLLAAALGYVRIADQDALTALGLGKNIRSALKLLSLPQEKIKEFINALPQGTDADTVREIWAGTEKLFANYVEGVRNKLRIITKGSMGDLTRYSDFSLGTVGDKKTALFLILPEEGEFQALLVPFYAFMFRRLNQLAAGMEDGKLPYPTRFIMDEFANIGRVPDIDKVCALGRSKGIMVHIAVQNIGQLQGLYKRNNIWEAVVGNCPIKLCLGVDDIHSARFFTDIMGEADVEDIDERKEVTTLAHRLQLSKKTQYTKETDTMRPYELLQLPDDDLVVVLRGKQPLYLQKYGWVHYPQAADIESAEKTSPAEWEFPDREKDTVEIDKPATNCQEAEAPENPNGNTQEAEKSDSLAGID